MRRFWVVFFVVVVGCVLAFAPVVKADEATDMRTAAQKISGVMGEAEKLYAKGAFEESFKVLFDTFPEATRTPVQTLILANVIYRHHPKQSYEMHRQAALAMPSNPGAQLEWAVEQHRAKEWAGAAATYEAFDKLTPGFIPAYGLWAQCLIEQGKLKDACAMWGKFETASRGSIQEFQRLTCEANWRGYPMRQRAELFKKASEGDLNAARGLVLLDANFPTNWWVRGPMPTYLAGDAEMLRKAPFAQKDQAAAKELIDAAEIAQAASRRRVNVTDLLKEKGYLFDPKGTLPKDPGAMCVIVTQALTRRTLTREEARDAWGEAVFAAGKASKDASLLNVAANIHAGTAELEKVDQFGWDNTKDERFASSLIAGLYTKGELRPDDARLARALKEFPLSAQIAGVYVSLLIETQQVTEQALVAGIKAEYNRFSITAVDPQPSARVLGEYFRALDALLKKKVRA